MDLIDHIELFEQYIRDVFGTIEELLIDGKTDEADSIIKKMEEKELLYIEYEDEEITSIEYADGNEEFVRKLLKPAIENLDDSDFIEMWNEYARDNYPDDEIYHNDPDVFDEHFSKASDVIQKMYYGDYDFTHKYWQYNGYANIESFNSPQEEVDIDLLVDDLIEKEDFDLLIY